MLGCWDVGMLGCWDWRLGLGDFVVLMGFEMTLR